MKMSFRTILPAVAASVIASSPAHAITIIETTTNGNSKYRLVESETPINWNDARAQAKKLGGYLANITSLAEQNFLKTWLDDRYRNVWIGASDVDQEGTWIWMDGPEAGLNFWNGIAVGKGGTPVGGAYAGWVSTEPNQSGNEDYASFNTSYTGRGTGGWNDLNVNGNNVTRAFFVESAVPEPGTWMLMILGLSAVGFAIRRRASMATRVSFV